MEGVPLEIVYTASFRGNVYIDVGPRFNCLCLLQALVSHHYSNPLKGSQVKSRGWRGLGGEYKEGECEYGECVSVHGEGWWLGESEDSGSVRMGRCESGGVRVHEEDTSVWSEV